MSRASVRNKFILSSPSTQLVFSAIVSGLVYLVVFAIPFPLIRLYDTIPPVDYTKLTNYSQSGFLAYVFGISALFGFYFWAIRLAHPADPQYRTHWLGRRSTTAARFILLSSSFFGLILVFSYPLTAIDLFIYAIRTRGWALYDLPPLSTPPETLPTSDPWLGLAGEWIDAASPYGPLWEQLSLGAFYLSDGNFLDHLVTLKIISLLAYLGCGWLIYQTLRDHQPRWALTGTLAFAWNPLILFESVQNAHNDIVMLFFLLAATWLFGQKFKEGRTQLNPLLINLLVCCFLAFSVLIKFVTVMVVPFYLLALVSDQSTWRRRISMLILYGLTVVMIILVSMAPVWPGWENWAVLTAGSGAGRSLTALVILGLRDMIGTNLAFDLTRSVILGSFAIIYVYYLWQTFVQLQQSSSASPASLFMPASLRLAISPAFFVLFWYVLTAVPVFHGWYILWFFPLAVFLFPQQRPLMASVIFSVTALLIIPYFETIRVWYPLLLRNHFLGHLLGVPLLIVPPALTLLRRTSSTTNSEVSSVKRET